MTSAGPLFAGLKGPEHSGKLDFIGGGQQGDMAELHSGREPLLFGFCLTS